MAFQQALSGLSTAGKAIDVTSNNIANASTVGYKASVAHFSDVYARSLNNAGTNQVGIGVNLSGIAQQYTQGNITSTNNPLDISINGNGFFRMDNNGEVTYTRNGQFHLDKNGYIVNDQGLKLTGYGAVNGVVTSTSAAPLQISASDILPAATGSSTTGDLVGVKANLALDSREDIPDVAWVDGTATGTWTPSPETYNWSTSLDIYDTLGNAHTLTMYFVRGDNAREWGVFASVDGTTNARVSLTGGAAVDVAGNSVAGITFDENGKLLTGSGASVMNVSIDLDGVMSDLGAVNSAGATLSFPLDFLGTTQTGKSFANNRLEQDGYEPGSLTSLSVSTDGTVLGNYSNGKTFVQGQIALANFTNPNGLRSQGNNQWVATAESGAAMLGTPGSSNLGALASATVEESNVDLTAELVNLITNQRNYQANAQSVKTQDQIMQTLINLR